MPREARSQELNVAQHVTSTQAGVPGTSVAWERTSCHPVPPPVRPAGQPTSSLVSLEVDLARVGLGLSEAVSARASRLFSWHREEACGWAVLGEEGPSQGRQAPWSEKFHLSPCYPPQSPTA